MATTHCFTPVLGKRIRVTKLDNCGRVPAPAAADSLIATDGFITITLTSEVEDGTEIIQRNAAGALCVNERMNSSFKRFSLEIEFCGVNPSLLSLVSNAKPYSDYLGDVAGFTVNEGELTKKFSLELWTGLTGQACASGTQEASGYLVLPYVGAGVLGDITIDGENAVTFSITGAYTIGGNAWGNGPYKVVYGGAVTNEVQTVTITGVPTGGSFKLSYAGQTTANIAYNATSAVTQTALEALSNIDPGDVTVGGGPAPATPLTVTFGGKLGGKDIAAMTASHTFTGGTTPNVAVTTPTPGLPGTAQVLPSGLDPMDHMLLMDTGIAPPPSACSLQAMPT